MNCAEVSRRVSDILNGDTPDLAAGRTMAAGENPEGTLEWMDLENFPPENQMALRDWNRPPSEFTDAAYRRVYDALSGRPPGTHANLFVTWRSPMPNIPGGGHVLNAFVDEAGHVKFLDAQPHGGRISEAFPPGHQGPHPKNPYNGDITSIQFAVREPGGRWEGPPRPANMPPASQMQHIRPTTMRGGPTPDLPGLHTPDSPITSRLNPETPTTPRHATTPHTHAPTGRTPESHTPATHAPDGHTPDPSTPGTRAPESRTPTTHAPDGRAPQSHAPAGRTPEPHTPDGHAPDSRTPESHPPEGAHTGRAPPGVPRSGWAHAAVAHPIAPCARRAYAGVAPAGGACAGDSRAGDSPLADSRAGSWSARPVRVESGAG